MKLESPLLPGTTLAGLAEGGGGGEAVDRLSEVQRLKNRLLVWGVAAEASSSGHPRADLAGRAYRLLADLETRAPVEVDRVLRYPAVGAWAWQAYRSLATAEGAADPGRLALVALSAAIRARRLCRLPVPVSDGVVMLPSLGEVAAPALGDVVEVSVRPVGARVELVADGKVIGIDPGRDGLGWRGLRRLPVTAGFSLVLDDLDPYRWVKHEVLVPRLSPTDHDRWRSRLKDAWRVLTAHHHRVAEEVAAGIQVLTPIRGPLGGQDSASSRETFGTVALSEPPDGLWLAVTLAHEIQHAKLTAVTDMIEFFLPGSWPPRHYAPWRDDPRPPYGLLQGAYAYLGVTEFWRVQRRFERGESAFRAETEFARWRGAAYGVTGTLLSIGCLNERGREFVARMRHSLERCLAEPVDPAANAEAERQARLHLEDWVRRNPTGSPPQWHAGR